MGAMIQVRSHRRFQTHDEGSIDYGLTDAIRAETILQRIKKKWERKSLPFLRSGDRKGCLYLVRLIRGQHRIRRASRIERPIHRTLTDRKSGAALVNHDKALAAVGIVVQ
jgi:hypothetical protein